MFISNSSCCRSTSKTLLWPVASPWEPQVRWCWRLSAPWSLVSWPESSPFWVSSSSRWAPTNPLSFPHQPSEDKRIHQSETASTELLLPPSQPILESKLKIQDTCGVHNLHGMPGVLGAIVGAVTAALATMDVYGKGWLSHPPKSEGGLDECGVRRWVLVCLSGWKTSSPPLQTEASMRPNRAACRRFLWPSHWASPCWEAWSWVGASEPRSQLASR